MSLHDRAYAALAAEQAVRTAAEAQQAAHEAALAEQMRIAEAERTEPMKAAIRGQVKAWAARFAVVVTDVNMILIPAAEDHGSNRPGRPEYWHVTFAVGGIRFRATMHGGTVSARMIMPDGLDDVGIGSLADIARGLEMLKDHAAKQADQARESERYRRR